MKAKESEVSVPLRIAKPLADRIERLGRSHDRELHQECAAILRRILPALEGRGPS